MIENLFILLGITVKYRLARIGCVSTVCCVVLIVALFFYCYI